MRSIIALLFVCLQVKGQSFYEKMMTLNIAIADSSSDWMELERSVGVFDRLSAGIKDDWLGNYYKALCSVRAADMYTKKDTTYVKKKITAAKEYLKATDSVVPNEPEIKVLKVFAEAVQARVEKVDENKLKTLEQKILMLKNDHPQNPRVCLMYGYFLVNYYSKDKEKRNKVREALKAANELYASQKTVDFLPSWGRKWTGDLVRQTNNK